MKIQEATQTGDQKGLLLTMTALRKKQKCYNRVSPLALWKP